MTSELERIAAISATDDEFVEACRDPQAVEFTVTGRNGKRVTLRYGINEYEEGQVEFAGEIENEIEEFEQMFYMTPHLRPTGARHGKVGLAFTWRPKFPSPNVRR